MLVEESPYDSATQLLEKYETSGCGKYTVKLVNLSDEPGFKTLAFVLPDMLRRFGGRMREIAMDSACETAGSITFYSAYIKPVTAHLGNTNGAKYELYSVLGELYGSGFPLGYILVQSDGSGSHGAKERLLSEFLRHLREQWTISPIITLSDKDLSEIAAMRQEFSGAKHQLCYWHALRAVKKRLATLRRAPAPYNVTAARDEFDWIADDFVPIAQSKVPLVRSIRDPFPP